MLRRPALLALLLGAAATREAAAQPVRNEALPLRNLLVELRQAEGDGASVDTGGALVIRSDGSMQGAARGSVTTRSRDAAAASVQQLLVLNGGRGAMRLAQAVAYQFVQVTLTPRGIEATPGTVWRDSGTGFVVHPRWPGGTQPATVELSAESGETRLLTTAQLPLGEWVTIARMAAGSAGAQGRCALQMRVTLP